MLHKEDIQMQQILRLKAEVARLYFTLVMMPNNPRRLADCLSAKEPCVTFSLAEELPQYAASFAGTDGGL